jgi:hypothetical protein
MFSEYSQNGKRHFLHANHHSAPRMDSTRPLTGSVESSMNLGGGFDRFGFNLGECARNLLAFEGLKAGPDAKAAPSGQGRKTPDGKGPRP